MSSLIGRKYDIIIIGGGPAGATAGCLLSNLGHKVLIIDKAKFPRDKLCGGLLTKKALWLNERIFNETEQSLKNKGIINYTSNGYELWNKYKLLVKSKKDVELYYVDRFNYDSLLLKKARSAGARVIEGDQVLSIDIDNNEIKTSKGKSFSGNYMIGADGVNSIVRKSFPKDKYNPKKWRRNLVTAIEIFIKRDEIKSGNNLKDLNMPILYLALVRLGYAWLFPRENRVVFGIGAIYKKKKGSLLESFKSFLRHHGIEDPDKYKKKAHSVPCGYFLTKPIHKNVLLVGDAGGYVDPLLGEGIFYAQRTAELAAWAIHRNIVEGRPLDKVYKKMLWKYVLPEFFNGKIVRQIAFYISENINHVPVKLFFMLMAGILHDVLQGIRTNRGFFKRRIHEDVALNALSTYLTKPKDNDKELLRN